MEVTSADSDSSVRPPEEKPVDKGIPAGEENIKDSQPAPQAAPSPEVLPTAPDYMGNNIDTTA